MLEEMVARAVPVPEVVTGSTAVVAFGDPRTATVATLGINPSWREFLADDGSLLCGPKRRLATLASLHAESTASLRPDQIRSAIEDCAEYFRPDRNPYRRWFDPLDETLQAALGVSFYDHTACHLDLVQWATRPAWSELSRQAREILLSEGLPHLQCLLRHGNVSTVLLNGRQVIDHAMAAQLGELRPSGEVRINSHRSCSLYMGESGAVTFIGWSTNLQSSWGIGVNFRARLAAAVRDLAAVEPRRIGLDPQLAERQFGTVESRHGYTRAGKREPWMRGRETVLDVHGFVAKGTTAENKRELLEVLRAWLNASEEPTIGPVANYGGKAWIVIRLNRGRMAVLNADTKRAAVGEYVRDAETRGADVAWSILPNRNGRWNKLAFQADGEPTPGWYCYLRPSANGRGQV
jgi:hypothetical protein